MNLHICKVTMKKALYKIKKRIFSCFPSNCWVDRRKRLPESFIIHFLHYWVVADFTFHFMDDKVNEEEGERQTFICFLCTFPFSKAPLLKRFNFFSVKLC